MFMRCAKLITKVCQFFSVVVVVVGCVYTHTRRDVLVLRVVIVLVLK